ncbi:mechanosensitive ion channel family protein [Gordonia sp. TBRC 11910]|uniref:Mechanosensitive ion channel family protein n=1 Tax=Gordonia asplenii TaxID=2725283 RepID=A0A848KUH5_9ACTN|nr:mechanosensitive ion channel family protein [Gordonia asplenii]NMO01879.1 mechanosensitive ion channel family protein [Gordonia asplenii]
MTDTTRDWLIDKPIHIAIYVALALVVRYVMHLAIDRVTGQRRPADVVRRRLWKRRRSARATPPVDDAAELAVGERGGVGSWRLAGESLRSGLRHRTPDQLRDARNRDARTRRRRLQRAHTIGSVLKSAVSFTVLIWVILQSLAIVGVNVAPFIASAGIVGVALGFGAQNLVRDFLSGLFMLFEDQYGVGDVVDLGDAVGTVESVGLRVTTVRDQCGTLWYCRNGEIMRVGNFSQDYAVAFLQLPISYGSDVDLACRVALDTAQAVADEEDRRDDVLAPPEMLGVDGLKPDAITLRLTITVRAGAQWSMERELRRRIRQAFDANGISAPYPNGLPVSALQSAVSAAE